MGFHTPHVWKTTTAGSSWTDWTGNLPDAPVTSLLIDAGSGLIYAGTDVGVFSSPTAGSASWTEVGPAPGTGTGFLPSAPVTAIRMFNGGTIKRLRASTYGRGIWEFDISSDFTVPGTLTDPLAANPGQTTTTSMTISPVGNGPFGGTVTYTCSGLPAGAKCVFLPTQISGTASATTVTITVSSKGPFTGPAGPQKRMAQQRRLWVPLGLPLAGLVLVGFGGRRLPRRLRAIGLCAVLITVAFLLACGGGGSSSPPPPPPVTVSVSPSTVNTLYPNLTSPPNAPPQTQVFTATVHNSTNQAVTWQVNGAGGNATVGTIDASGNYTAPASVPNPATFNVTAVAQADSTKTGNASVTIQTPTPSGPYPITVTVSEGSVQHITTFTLNVN
jgi:hypothetical protein